MINQSWLQLVPFVVVAIPILFVSSRIMRKIGISGWWGIVWMLPPLSIGLFIWMAWAEWPIEKELQQLRALRDAVQRVDN